MWSLLGAHIFIYLITYYHGSVVECQIRHKFLNFEESKMSKEDFGENFEDSMYDDEDEEEMIKKEA